MCIRDRSEAIGKGSVQAINYFVAQKYVEAIAKLASAPNQKVLLMPLDTSGLVGTLAGVAGLAQEAFSQNGTHPLSGSYTHLDVFKRQGAYFVRLPLVKAPQIVHGNALTLDWRAIVKPEALTVIVGNPPFVGAKRCV